MPSPIDTAVADTAAALQPILPRSVETIGAAVRWGAAQIAAALPEVNALLEARALLLDCLPFDDYATLLAQDAAPLPAEAAAQYPRHIAARAAGQPVAYILGWREFYGRKFKTTPAALIPRPETETLVEAALHHLPAAAHVLDLGAGCGAIGISIALTQPQSVVTLTDVSEDTLALARENAARLKTTNTRFACGDWYAPLNDLHAPGAPDGQSRFNLIVSNPPYVAADDEHLRRGDLRFEPPLALVGGADGLAALSTVVGNAPRALVRGGVLLVEHGNTQAAAVRAQFAAAGFCGIRTLPDLSAQPRVTFAVLP